MKSTETSSSSQYWKIPFILPAAAAFTASFTSLTVTLRPTSATKSTQLTLGVGTRRATPSSFPFRAGMTSPTVFAAPVVVGTMDSAGSPCPSQVVVGPVEKPLVHRVGVAASS